MMSEAPAPLGASAGGVTRGGCRRTAAGSEERGMSELYGRYHGRLLALARAATADGAWKSKLRELLAEFDDDCRRLSAPARYMLRNELAGQTELEALQFSDPDKRAVLSLALKHFDAREA